MITHFWIIFFFAIGYSSFVIRISSFSLTPSAWEKLELGKAVAVDAYVAHFTLFRNCARAQAESGVPSSKVANHTDKSNLNIKEK